VLRVPLILLAVLTASRVWFGLTVPPNMDEAYYFGWGEHLQLSYIDHAPMVGWLSGAARALFGSTLFSAHIMPFLSFGLVVLALFIHFGGRDRANWPLLLWALVIWLATPVFHALSILTYPDHALIGFSALALVFFARFVEAEPRAARGDLYLGALFLGLAGLSKYSAVLLGLGLLITLVSSKRLRSQFADPHLYLAAALSLCLMSPVLIWNVMNGFPTLNLHGVERFESHDRGFALAGLVRLFAQSLIYLSPLGLGLGLWAVARGAKASATGRLMLSVTIVGMLPFVLLSLWVPAAEQVAPHWLTIGFLPLMLALPGALGRGWRRGLHLGYGLVVIAVLNLYYVTAPALTLALGLSDREAVVTFGQDQLARAARDAAATTGATLFAVPTYQEASKLAFQLGSSRDVVTLDPRMDQYDFWQRPDAIGEDAIIIVQPGNGEKFIAPAFQSTEPLGEITTTRGGQTLAVFRLILGHGFKGVAR
jgi:4-amino-4-deoxy-L-arabinose transferase-like glycosyltransferase